MNQRALSSLIWSVADLLRGDFKQSELPMTEIETIIAGFSTSEIEQAAAPPPRELRPVV